MKSSDDGESQSSLHVLSGEQLDHNEPVLFAGMLKDKSTQNHFNIIDVIAILGLFCCFSVACSIR